MLKKGIVSKEFSFAVDGFKPMTFKASDEPQDIPEDAHKFGTESGFIQSPGGKKAIGPDEAENKAVEPVAKGGERKKK